MLKKLIGGIHRWQHHKQPLSYTPIQQLEAGESFCWQATGDDPGFNVKPAKGPMPRGWYMVEVKVRSTLSRLFAKLYYDFGNGFSEELSCKLPIASGRLIKKVVFFSRIPSALRFDPCEEQGEFTIETLRLCKLTSSKAKRLMMKKVGQWHPEVKLEAGSLKLEALQRAYSECFEYLPLSGSYQQWIERTEKPLFGDLSRLSELSGELGSTPLISVVMPVYNVPERFLREAIESVRKQVYSNWELCIADDCSTEPHIQSVLREYAELDSRIKVVFREENGHISHASNSALELATGQYIALLDHDDMLAPHALFAVVDVLNKQPELEFIYSDEDFIDEEGHRLRPHFKSQWNPELLNAHNYITHLAVAKRDLVNRVGNFRPGFEGAQDYDLFLRITHELPADKIGHIPHVLYHWRAIEGSTAASADAKNYATIAGLKALSEVHSGQRDTAVKHGSLENFYRVTYPVPEKAPLVSLMIPTRNGLDIIKPCVDSILDKTHYSNYEILIIDNQSDDPETLKWFSEVSQKRNVRVLSYDHPFNYSLINNFAASQANGEILALVNNDVEVISPDWLDEMVSLAVRDETGCVGAKLYYPDGDIQHAGVILGLGGYAAHAHRGLPGDHPGYFNRANVRQNLSAVTGACLVVRKDIFHEVGGLESAFTVAYNDVDFCLKVQAAGYSNVYTPYAELYHHESKTRGFDDTPEKQARFEQEKRLLAGRWGSLLENDPFYNPNLTRSNEHFSIAV